MDLPLLNTVLKQGEPLHEDYTKSGGYGEQDEKDYVDFMKSFFENGFPTGDYVVDGFVEFYVKSSYESKYKEAYMIKAQINFKVSE